jgi:hypothetical protein
MAVTAALVQQVPMVTAAGQSRALRTSRGLAGRRSARRWLAMKSTMRGTISARKREPLKTP